MPDFKVNEEEVDLWMVDLNSNPEVDYVLSPAESIRANQFRDVQNRTHFCRAHTALREVLSLYTGLPPLELTYRETMKGKPFLVGNPVHFNLSHTDGLAVIGVSGNEVGVDVELVSRSFRWEEVSNAFFSQTEKSILAASPSDSKGSTFYRLWTRKEAILKCLGLGITALDDDLEVPFSGQMYSEQKGDYLISAASSSSTCSFRNYSYSSRQVCSV